MKNTQELTTLPQMIQTPLRGVEQAITKLSTQLDWMGDTTGHQTSIIDFMTIGQPPNKLCKAKVLIYVAHTLVL